MVRLILKYLNKIKQLIVIIPLIVAIMLFAGLFFANQKSKPEFESKTEKLMFDTKNQSPKYVITLPEQDVKKKKSALVKEEKKEEKKEVRKTNNEKLNELDIPFLSRLTEANTSLPMAHIVPIDDLLEKSETGLSLPIKKDSRKPWEVYGRKVDVMPMFNKVVIVIKDMGANTNNTELMSDRLSGDISFSFSPYAANFEDKVVRARERGHETYIDLILPSHNVLLEDAGVKAIDFNNSIEKNIQMLEQSLNKKVALSGWVIRDGVDDEKYKDYFEAIMRLAEKRGLILLDATYGDTIKSLNVKGLDRVKADIVIDKNFDRTVIRKQLEEAEYIARLEGSVVIVVEPKPVAILEIANWVATFSKQLTYEEMKLQKVTSFEKPFILVPLSNVAVEY